MQALNWYYQRLKAMSPGEIVWRMRSSLRDRTDRLLVGRRQKVRTLEVILDGDGLEVTPGFCVCDTLVGEKANLWMDDKSKKQWYYSLLARARQISMHRLDFFDLNDRHLGDPIIWNPQYLPVDISYNCFLIK